MAANILEIKNNGDTIEIGADSRNVDYSGSIPNVNNVNGALESLQSQVDEVKESVPTMDVEGVWNSLGDSITRQDADTNNGYQTKVQQHIKFTSHINSGINGTLLAYAISSVQVADYYTCAFGVNDWKGPVTVGSITDFINKTGTGTFFGAYRELIDAIYTANSSAVVILCTPRKAYGYNSQMPEHWYDPINGRYLKDFADAVKEIGEFMSFPVCDWFGESDTNQVNLAANSIDVALHPNAAGHQKMANLLVQTFKKVLNCG